MATETNPEEYNGWTNRETWAAMLWINNDQYMQTQARLLAKADSYGDAVRDWIEDLAQDVIDGNASRDTRMMLCETGSLWRVNWREINDALVEE